MMGLSGNLDSGHVVEIRIGVRENSARSLQTSRFAVVQDDDSKLVNGIILITGAANRIHDQLVIFAATSDEGVDGRHVVSRQPHLGPVSLLEGPHRPGVVHE